MKKHTRKWMQKKTIQYCNDTISAATAAAKNLQCNGAVGKTIMNENADLLCSVLTRIKLRRHLLERKSSAFHFVSSVCQPHLRGNRKAIKERKSPNKNTIPSVFSIVHKFIEKLYYVKRQLISLLFNCTQFFLPLLSFSHWRVDYIFSRSFSFVFIVFYLLKA